MRTRDQSPPRSIAPAVCALVLSLLATGPAGGGQVRPLNLEELAQRAGRIFSGRCVSTEASTHSQLGIPVTRVTFEIERAIKGETGPQLTIEIAGLTGLGPTSLDVPHFAAGERVVLFVYPESPLGLTSPVGLGQGRFTLVRDKAGQELAVNALGNRHLLRGLSPTARERVAASVVPWEGQPALPVAALLDGVKALLEQADRTPDSGGRAGATGGAR